MGVPVIEPREYVVIPLTAFKFLGLYVDRSDNTYVRYLQVIYTFLSVSIILILPVSGQILFAYSLDNLEDFLPVLNILLIDGLIAVKALIFVYNYPLFLEIMRHIDHEDFKPKQPEHFELVTFQIKYARTLAKVYFIVTEINMTVVALGTFVAGERELSTNLNYVFFDHHASPYFEIISVFHTYYKLAIGVMFAAFQSLGPAMMRCAIAQLEILKFDMENLSLLTERARAECHSDGEAAEAVIRNDVIRHMSILKYTEMIGSFFSPHFFFQFILICVVICGTLYNILSIESLKDGMVELLWTSVFLVQLCVDVYYTCLAGDEIKTKSEELVTAAYFSDWAEQSAPIKRSIHIFMTRTQRPILIRAGNFFLVSINTFSNIMNWSYKAFTIMNETNA